MSKPTPTEVTHALLAFAAVRAKVQEPDPDEKAEAELERTMIVVARVAQELSDEATQRVNGSGALISEHTVPGEVMDELRQALRAWKAASAAFMEASRAEAKS
jgi:hypothetical protein